MHGARAKLFGTERFAFTDGLTCGHLRIAISSAKRGPERDYIAGRDTEADGDSEG